MGSPFFVSTDALSLVRSLISEFRPRFAQISRTHSTASVVHPSEFSFDKQSFTHLLGSVEWEDAGLTHVGCRREECLPQGQV